MHDVIESFMLKRFIKAQDRLMDFNITKCKKCFDTVSDFILQQTFKKLPLVEFWYSIKEKYPQFSKKVIKYFSFFLLQICVMPNFLHMLNQNNISQKNEWRSSWELIVDYWSRHERDLQKTKQTKNKTMSLLSLNFWENTIIFHKKILFRLTYMGLVLFSNKLKPL